MEANGLHHADGCTLFRWGRRPLCTCCVKAPAQVPRPQNLCQELEAHSLPRNLVQLVVRESLPEGLQAEELLKASSLGSPAQLLDTGLEDQTLGPRIRCLAASWVSQVAEASQFQRPPVLFLAVTRGLAVVRVGLVFVFRQLALEGCDPRGPWFVGFGRLYHPRRVRDLSPSSLLPPFLESPLCGSVRARSDQLVSGTYWVQKC